MALVMVMVKHTNITNVEFNELVSEGNMALLRSVEKFNVSRGYKFSTYACRSILKSFSRLAGKTSRYRRLFPVEFNPSWQRSNHSEHEHQMQWDDSVAALREILTSNRAELTDVEQTVLKERFPMSPSQRKRPLTEVAVGIGLSKERVRQIQIAAINKIRGTLEEQRFVPMVAQI